MLTKFGKELKKIRVDHDEILRDMAAKLNVTAAYLSAVENGNRNVPDSWIHILSDKYQLTEKDVIKLQKAAFEDKGVVKVQFDAQNETEANLALSFARKFRELDDEDALKIQKILNNSGR